MASLDDVVDELYGGTLDDFVARRDAAVRAAKAVKDKETAARIGSLRKPTVAAWAVNVLVRDDPALADALRDLGEGMRDAERSLDGPALRELGKQRRALVSGLVARARRLAADAGQKLSTAAAQEVEHTLTAALADPHVADAVAAGTLTHGTEHVGFGAASAGGTDAQEREASGTQDDRAAARTPLRGGADGRSAPTGRAGGRAAGSRAGAGGHDDGSEGPGSSNRAGRSGSGRADSTSRSGSSGRSGRPAADDASARAVAEERQRARREQERERLRRRHEQARAAREAADAELDRVRTRHDDAATEEQAATAALEDAEQASQDAYAAEEELVRLLADVRRRLADARAALPRVDEALVAARARAREKEKAVRAAGRELDRARKAAERAREQEQRAADSLP